MSKTFDVGREGGGGPGGGGACGGDAPPSNSLLAGDTMLQAAMRHKWPCMTSDGYRMRIAGHPDAAAGFKGYIIKIRGEGDGLKVDVFWDNGKVIAGYSAAPGKEDLVIAPKSAPGDAGPSTPTARKLSQIPADTVTRAHVDAHVGYLYTSPGVHKKGSEISLWDSENVSIFGEQKQQCLGHGGLMNAGMAGGGATRQQPSPAPANFLSPQQQQRVEAIKPAPSPGGVYRLPGINRKAIESPAMPQPRQGGDSPGSKSSSSSEVRPDSGRLSEAETETGGLAGQVSGSWGDLMC